ncbi:unnamed protein product, partial [Musa acuminata subsp. burmannicoides]
MSKEANDLTRGYRNGERFSATGAERSIAFLVGPQRQVPQQSGFQYRIHRPLDAHKILVL